MEALACCIGLRSYNDYQRAGNERQKFDHLLKLPPDIDFTVRTPFIPNKSRTSRIAQNYTSRSSLDLIPERDTYRNILEEQHPSNGID